jgi:hypothetical protein
LRILLGSESTAEVVLRLVLFFVTLRVMGDPYFRRSRLTHAARIQLGLGVSFLLVFLGTTLQGGRPGIVTPILLGLHMATACALLLVRAIRGLRVHRLQARGEGIGLAQLAALRFRRADLLNVLPYLCLLAVLWIVAYADWPRWVPLTSDPQQHAFFARKVLDYHGIPWALTEMGGLPFGYPAGTGVLGYLAFTFSGLRPAETVSLLSGIFMALCSLALTEAGRKAGFSWLQRCLLALIPFMLGVTSLIWSGQSGVGKIVALWLFLSWLVQLFLMRQEPANTLASMAQVTLLLVMAAELNPVIAPLWAWLVLLTLLCWKRDGLLTRRTVLTGASFLGVGFLLLLLGDPFFRGALWGKGIPTPSLAHLPKEATELQLSSLHRFPGKFRLHLRELEQNFPRSRQTWLILIGLILVGYAKSLVHHLGSKKHFLILGLALVPSLLLTSLATILAIPPSSGLYLLGIYNTQVLALIWGFAAFVLAVWALPRIAALVPRWWLRRLWMGGALSVFLCCAVAYGVVPHYSRHGTSVPTGVPPVDRSVPAGLEDATTALARLWEHEPNTKVLFVNYAWNLTVPERWIMVDQFSTAAGLVRHANPAFFFYKGSADYSNDNYDSKVCETLDARWLVERGIRWVLLPPKERIERRCATLRQMADGARYMLKEIVKPPR